MRVKNCIDNFQRSFIHLKIPRPANFQKNEFIDLTASPEVKRTEVKMDAMLPLGDIMFGPWAAYFPVSLCHCCVIIPIGKISMTCFAFLPMPIVRILGNVLLGSKW